MNKAAYDRIGRGYSAVRRPDPRIAARIDAALGDAPTVLNVGAGAGSYEPPDREVTAVEPSAEMIAQRPAGSAPVLQARAEDLPFDDDSFDAAMAIVTVHHWRDHRARAYARCSESRATVCPPKRRSLPCRELLADSGLPAWVSQPHPRALPTSGLLGTRAARPTGHGRGTSYPGTTRLPGQLLPSVLAASERLSRLTCPRRISIFHRLPVSEVSSAVERLRRDLDDGLWAERYATMREMEELDVGLRLLVTDLA